MVICHTLCTTLEYNWTTTPGLACPSRQAFPNCTVRWDRTSKSEWPLGVKCAQAWYRLPSVSTPLLSWNRAKNSHQLAYFKAMQSHHLTNEPIIWKPATFYLWTRNVCTNCFYQFFDYKTRKQLRFKHSACSFKTLGIKAKVCPYVFVVFQSSSNRPWHQLWNISGVIFW